MVTLLKYYNAYFPKVREVTNHKRTGLNKDEVDDRDFVVAVQEVQEVVQEIPPVHLIDKLPLVKKQGNLSSCASHAVIGAYETIMLNTNPRRYLEGSEMYHYYNARKYVNNTFPNDQGMSLRDACKTLHKYHMATEYACPYIITKYNEEPSMVAYMTSGAYKIKSYARLYDIEDVKRSLINNVPIICGIPVHTNFYYLNKGNYLYRPEGTFRGNHATLVVGFDEDRKVFIIRNSWGSETWGKDGDFEMSYQDFLVHSFDWWVIKVL